MVKKRRKNQSSNPSNPRRLSFKEREAKDIENTLRTLNKIQEILSYGFSDENFGKVNFLYRKIQDRLYPTEREALGEVWRNVYTDSNTLDAVELQVNAIRARFLTNQ